MEEIQDIENLINEVELNQQPIKEVAHYTSMKALNNIIDGIQMQGTPEAYLILRATHALETDDPEELREGSEFLMKILSNLEEGLIDKYKLSNYMTDVKNSKSFNRFSEDDIIKWFYGGKRTPYIISFSKYINQLSMWLMPYAVNGEGACLVFDFSKMIYSNDQLVIRSPFPVIYGKRLGYLKYKNEFLHLIWSEFEYYCNSVVNITDPDIITQCKLQALEVIYAFVSSYFKREVWHSQQEVRIMVTTKDDQSSCIMIDEKKRNFIEIPVPINCLKQVILGPKVNDTDVKEIRRKLTSFGFSPDDIFKSEEPLQ